MRHRSVIGPMLIAAAAAVSFSGCERRTPLGPHANAAEATEIRDKLVAGSSGTGGSTTEAAAPTEPTGWATLRGTFKVIGEAPTPAKIIADKDTEVCGKHPLVDESVTVGAGGSLQNVAIFLRAKKPKVHESYEESAKAEVVLDNKNCRFEPHVAVMRTSQTLLIKNSDPVGHNTKGDPTSNAGFNVLIPANTSSDQHLPTDEALPFKVGCSIHPWMGGWVVVKEHPYAAVTNSSGEFELKNLPAGIPLEFQVWQEKKSNLPGVKVSGKDAIKVDGKGRFKITLQPDQEENLTFELPAENLK